MYLSPSELTHTIYLVYFSGPLTSELGPVLLESPQGHIPPSPSLGTGDPSGQGGKQTCSQEDARDHQASIRRKTRQVPGIVPSDISEPGDRISALGVRTEKSCSVGEAQIGS